VHDAFGNSTYTKVVYLGLDIPAGTPLTIRLEGLEARSTNPHVVQ